MAKCSGGFPRHPRPRLRFGQAVGDFAHQVVHALVMLGGDRPPARPSPAHRPPWRWRCRRAPRPCWRRPAPACLAAQPGGEMPVLRQQPAFASNTKSTRSAWSTAVAVEARMRPGSVSGAASSSPAVSTSMHLAPGQLAASASLRSRVTPGVSATSASALPGKAVEQSGFADIGPAGDYDMRGSSAIGCQPRVAGELQQHAAGGDGRHDPPGAASLIVWVSLPASGVDQRGIAMVVRQRSACRSPEPGRTR